MIFTEPLRREHEAALAISCGLFDLIERYPKERDAYAIVLQLNKLVGLLRIHFAHEDVGLYPALTALKGKRVAKLARSYSDEMGGLALEIEQFARNWASSAVIAIDFDEFRGEAHALLLALAVRIEREDRYLYPLADAALSGVVGGAEQRAA